MTYFCSRISGIDPAVTCDIPGVTSFDGVYDGGLTDGTFTFRTTDEEMYMDGEYIVTITGATGIDRQITTTSTFMLTLGEPCASAQLSLAYNPFSDVTYYLQENSLQSLVNIQSVVRLDRSLATSSSCGRFGIEFHSDAGEEMDAILFESTNSGFTVLYQENEELIGKYEIRYRMFLEDYPERSVNSRTPFIVSIADPCV